MTLEEIKTKICDLRCSVEELQDWWDGLDNEIKSQLVGIPTPSRNDSAGEYDFKEFCEKWWNAKTITQKQSIYRDFYSDSLEYFDMLDA